MSNNSNALTVRNEGLLPAAQDWQDVALVTRASLTSRFQRYTHHDGDCLLWTGGKTGKGYGVVFIGRVNGKKTQTYAHRATWVLAHGRIPEGLFVCHKCDVKLCCNVEHLFLGTQLDNMRDAAIKGRTSGFSSRIPQSTVDEIRTRYAAKGITQAALAHEYDISFQHVSNIILYKRRERARS